MREQVKYVTARPSLKKPRRWYWQRPGHKLVRLPADPVQRHAMALKLTAAADGRAVAHEGTVAWTVETYQASDEYSALKSGTKKYYSRILNDVRRLAGKEPIGLALTRRVVIEFVNGYKKGMRKQAGAVLRNLFNTAIYHGHATVNHARDLRIRGGQRREMTWSDDDVKAFLSKCEDHAMTVAFYLLRYTAQRPNDCLMLNWTDYNGETIRLRQQKTGKLVDVACHRALRGFLDAARKTTRHTRIVSSGLRGLSYTRFCERFRRIANSAGLTKLQARDLRRTAAVYMAEAGCTESEIASIGGWSIESTRQILETYVPRTAEMARGAIKKWEQKDDRSLT